MLDHISSRVKGGKWREISGDFNPEIKSASAEFKIWPQTISKWRAYCPSKPGCAKDQEGKKSIMA